MDAFYPVHDKERVNEILKTWVRRQTTAEDLHAALHGMSLMERLHKYTTPTDSALVLLLPLPGPCRSSRGRPSPGTSPPPGECVTPDRYSPPLTGMSVGEQHTGSRAAAWLSR